MWTQINLASVLGRWFEHPLSLVLHAAILQVIHLTAGLRRLFGYSLGSLPLDKEMGNVRLGFEALKEGNGEVEE